MDDRPSPTPVLVFRGVTLRATGAGRTAPIKDQAVDRPKAATAGSLRRGMGAVAVFMSRLIGCKGRQARLAPSEVLYPPGVASPGAAGANLLLSPFSVESDSD